MRCSGSSIHLLTNSGSSIIKPVRGFAYSGKFWGTKRIIVGIVGDGVVVSCSVWIGFGVDDFRPEVKLVP